MSTTGSALVRLAVVLALGAGLAACSEDGDPTATGSPTGSATGSPTPSASVATDEDPVCAALTAEELTALAGRPMAASAGSTGANAVTDCDTTSEDLAVVAFWQARPDPGSLAQEVDDAAPDGLARSSVTVAGQPAALLVGPKPGQRVARVVTVVGDRSLLVGVAYLQGVGPEATTATLRALALGIAEQAAAAMG